MTSIPNVRSLLGLTLLASAASWPPSGALAAGDHVSIKSSGSALAQRVAGAMEAADLSPGAQLDVSEKGGVITVTGWTATLAARDRAARAVEGTSGVVFSHPDMVVRPTTKTSDDAIQALAEGALRSMGTPGLRVGISAGSATLSGSVRDPEARQAAETALASIDGVVAIQDEVVVQPVAGSRRAEVDAVKEPEEAEISAGDVTLSADGRHLLIGGVSHDVRASKSTREVTRVSPGQRRVVEEVHLVVTPASPSRK